MIQWGIYLETNSVTCLLFHVKKRNRWKIPPWNVSFGACPFTPFNKVIDRFLSHKQFLSLWRFSGEWGGKRAWKGCFWSWEFLTTCLCFSCEPVWPKGAPELDLMTHVYIEHTICLYTESIIINLTLPLNVLAARNPMLATFNKSTKSFFSAIHYSICWIVFPLLKGKGSPGKYPNPIEPLSAPAAAPPIKSMSRF